MSSTRYDPPPGSIRAFVAVALPPPLAEVVRGVQHRLRRIMQSDTIRWTRPHQWHLTLRFLGDLPEGQLDVAQLRLSKVGGQHSAFRLVLGELGCFPQARAAKVLWLGVTGEVEALTSLARAVVEALDGFGTPQEERPFRPHITLARMRSPEAIGQVLEHEARERLDREDPDWPVRSVELIQSELHPNGARYTTLAKFPLREVV